MLSLKGPTGRGGVCQVRLGRAIKASWGLLGPESQITHGRLSMSSAFSLACREEVAGARDQKRFYRGDTGRAVGKDQVRGRL